MLLPEIKHSTNSTASGSGGVWPQHHALYLTTNLICFSVNKTECQYQI